jgi:hypothetical protein
MVNNKIKKSGATRANLLHINTNPDFYKWYSVIHGTGRNVSGNLKFL